MCMKKNFILFIAILSLGFFMMSCEGPIGPAGPAGADGKDGKDGKDGVDAALTCAQCHNPTNAMAIASQYELSKHSYGEAAFEEAGNTACAPCHAHEGFKYVIQNNIPATFTLNASTGKYSNNYAATASTSYGAIKCETCHLSLHTTYGTADYAFATKAPVPLTMWGGAKTVNLPADGGKSHLCVKCHQPRPFTTSSSLSDGNVVDYASLVTNPNGIYFDTEVGNAAPNKHLPSYRFHVHYGVVGAVYGGVGGVEFTGTESYASSYHTANASCQDCHTAPMTGRAGGHTFKVRNGEGALSSSTSWNFNGCNTTDCHGAVKISATNTTYWVNPRNDIKTLLNTLATKINAIGGGQNILHSDSDGETNLWAGMTTGNFDGYLDIYDASANPNGYWRNPSNTTAANLAKPKFPTLTNAQAGALINFQFALREYSLGIHNYKYVKALLTNTIAKL